MGFEQTFEDHGWHVYYEYNASAKNCVTARSCYESAGIIFDIWHKDRELT